jgi:hypothetical protein
VFDAEVVDGLVYAYRARRELELPDATVRAIRSAIHRTARGAFWRYRRCGSTRSTGTRSCTPRTRR